MRGAICVFVKTPLLSPLKTRLGKTIGTDKALEFYKLSVKAVEETLKSSQSVKMGGLDPYWIVAEKEALNNPLWSSFPKSHQGEGGLGERLSSVYNHFKKQYDYVLFIGGDCPQFSRDSLEKAVGHFRGGIDFLFGPAKDGGFWLFGGGQPVPKENWTSVPYSSPQTLECLKASLATISKEIKLVESYTDVDEEMDLIEMEKELLEQPYISLPQKKILTWLKDLKNIPVRC